MLKTCDLSFYVDVGPSYWPDNMHEPLLIGEYLPLLIVCLVPSDARDRFWEWIGSCIRCGKTKQGIKALFCVKFSYYCGGYQACQMVWCVSCYFKGT